MNTDRSELVTLRLTNSAGTKDWRGCDLREIKDKLRKAYPMTAVWFDQIPLDGNPDNRFLGLWEHRKVIVRGYRKGKQYRLGTAEYGWTAKMA